MKTASTIKKSMVELMTTERTKNKTPDCEGTNGRYYLELPDGYRLVYDEDGYVGRYDPNLSEAI